MKTKILLPLIFLSIGISCNDGDNVFTELKSKGGLNYLESSEKWVELKKKNGNSYTYLTDVGSWTGWGSTTQLKIEDGVITSRVYQRYKPNDLTGRKEIIDTYTELAGDLGTHEQGAPLLTIDDLYSSCAKDYLVVDENKNTIYFETSEEGLMSLCGFVPDGCADDCFNGIRINSFEWL